MDYLNVGANGFAQIGDEHYFSKNRIEMRYLYDLIVNRFPIPDKLKFLCSFGIKAFNHDFGTYHEIILNFDDNAISDGYDEEDSENEVFLTQEEILYIKDNAITLPDPPKKLHDIFWDWFSEVEAFDLETVEITKAIKTKYLASLNTENMEHLTVTRA